MIEGHKKYTCWHKEDRLHEFQLMQMEYYYKICIQITPHEMKNFRYNLKNNKDKWCFICQENSHDTRKFARNMKNKPNYHTIYQTSIIN